jgi:ADP-ribose pyrophosphatase YjhB (NUDIX family)
MEKTARVTMTADVVILRPMGDSHDVLLIERCKGPYQGYYALPGGMLSNSETIEDCAYRWAKKETGIRIVLPDLVGVYSEPQRDPRGRYVSVAYTAIVDPSTTVVTGGDVAIACWFPVSQLPLLAFDHARIIRDTLTYYLLIKSTKSTREGRE